MSKIKFYFILAIAAIAIISCNKDDDNDVVVVPPKPYDEQYKTESALIETYLKTHYIIVENLPGETKDQDVTIAKLDANHTISIWDQKVYALKSRNVELHTITYKLYYLVLREGTGEKPCNVDDVLTSYNGKYLAEKTTDNVTSITSTQFEEIISPQSYTDLYRKTRGWKEIFPQFKSGESASNPDGTIKHTDFGAGVMFIPSGLAYYNTGNGSIPAYAPLVFSFKLYEIQRSDMEVKVGPNGSLLPDPDGVPSYQEDIDGDGYVWLNAELQTDASGKLKNPNPDDSDKDGIPDFLDFDDDGDGYATRGEIKDANGRYYPFNGAAEDDPLTLDINETYGIPRQYSLKNPDLPESDTNPRVPKPSDYTDPTRLRRHLDPNSHDMSN